MIEFYLGCCAGYFVGLVYAAWFVVTNYNIQRKDEQ